MRKKYTYLLTLVLLVWGTSCNDFLDETPDNRVELSSVKALNQLLLGSYPNNMPVVVAEHLSDNVDRRTGIPSLTANNVYQDEVYAWADIKDESGNDAPKDFWGAAYASIAAANQVLQVIEANDNGLEYQALKGEALMMRAFNHFQMVNMYGLHYNETTSETDPGIVYMEEPETGLNPHYDRHSVAEVYRRIERDIEEGLPLISEDAYQFARYRFNTQAALAFAARFNLYYGKYDKVIEYANEIFGSDASGLMRDKLAIRTMTRPSAPGDMAKYFTSINEKANFLVITPASLGRTFFNNYSAGKLYQLSAFVANNETIRSAGPWGTYNTTTATATFNIHSYSYASSSGYIANPVVSFEQKKANAAATTGVFYSAYVTFWAEETLLCRAEAYIAKGEFDKATADLALWMKYQIDPSITTVLTRELINDYYGNIDYFQPGLPTVKKKLNPLNFTISSVEQENFMQCLVHFRRIETTSLGLRWYDIKRLGIEIQRRDILKAGSGDVFERVTDELKLNDPRRALQIPPDVLSAGMTPTPR